MIMITTEIPVAKKTAVKKDCGLIDSKEFLGYLLFLELFNRKKDREG